MNYLILLLFLFSLSSCAVIPKISFENKSETEASGRIIQSSHNAIDNILKVIPLDQPLDKHLPVIVSSLVNIDDLLSSRLGRMISEQYITRLVERGYNVTELKLRERIFIRDKEGELLLSREIPEIAKKHSSQAVLVGTYSSSIHTVYITVKLVSVSDNQVISSYDYTLPYDSEIRSLLWQKPQ